MVEPPHTHMCEPAADRKMGKSGGVSAARCRLASQFTAPTPQLSADLRNSRLICTYDPEMRNSNPVAAMMSKWGFRAKKARIRSSWDAEDVKRLRAACRDLVDGSAARSEVVQNWPYYIGLYAFSGGKSPEDVRAEMLKMVKAAQRAAQPNVANRDDAHDSESDAEA